MSRRRNARVFAFNWIGKMERVHNGFVTYSRCTGCKHKWNLKFNLHPESASKYICCPIYTDLYSLTCVRQGHSSFWDSNGKSQQTTRSSQYGPQGMFSSGKYYMVGKTSRSLMQQGLCHWGLVTPSNAVALARNLVRVVGVYHKAAKDSVLITYLSLIHI